MLIGFFIFSISMGPQICTNVAQEHLRSDALPATSLILRKSNPGPLAWWTCALPSALIDIHQKAVEKLIIRVWWMLNTSRYGHRPLWNRPYQNVRNLDKSNSWEVAADPRVVWRRAHFVCSGLSVIPNRPRGLALKIKAQRRSFLQTSLWVFFQACDKFVFVEVMVGKG